MTRSWITLALGALLLLPAAAAAQDQDVTVYTVRERPRIGVVVDMQASAANNKLGATVQSVTPGGPAAKAGLEAGDIITKFNGTSLVGAAGDDAEQSGAGQKLIALAQALSPGDTVKVEYRRGTANRTATIVAADLGGGAWSMRTGPREPMTFDMQPMMRNRQEIQLDMERSMEDMGRPFHFAFDRAGFGLDLAEMNAGLGEYFGTAKGVLVLENPSDSTLPLKAGDVILTIGGREPSGVGQTQRILTSYDSGDVAKFEIMRMKKKLTLTWTVPASPRMRMPGNMRWRTNAPPGPPAAPSAAPRVKVRVAPSAPAEPASAPVAAPPAPPART
jgi:C-terminal processing protease CtpA/Prc